MSDLSGLEMEAEKSRNNSVKKTELCGDLEGCEVCSEKILKWTIYSNFFIAAITVIGSLVSGSVGLLADCGESICCIIASIAISYSIKLSNKHIKEKSSVWLWEKLEFIVALAVYSILFGLGLFITISSVIVMFAGKTASPGLIALPVAMTVTFISYMQYRYNLCAGKRLCSSGFVANAHSAKADMLTSIAVCLGIILSQLGPAFFVFDAFAATIVGLVIIKDASELWHVNFKAILDEGPGSDYREKIKEAIEAVFKGPVQLLRFKKRDQKFWVGLELDIPDNASMEDWQALQKKIKENLLLNIAWLENADFFLKSE